MNYIQLITLAGAAAPVINIRTPQVKIIRGGDSMVKRRGKLIEQSDPLLDTMNGLRSGAGEKAAILIQIGNGSTIDSITESGVIPGRQVDIMRLSFLQVICPPFPANLENPL